MPSEEPAKQKKPRYIFKITVVGPEDALLREVLTNLNENIVTVDGVTIGSTRVDLEESRVSTLMMSPGRSAMNLMLSLTFKGANAVIIVLREADPQTEGKYRNEIREALGEGRPTRVFLAGPRITKKKKEELLTLLNEIAADLVSERQVKPKRTV